jgi:hypothetical protein
MRRIRALLRTLATTFTVVLASACGDLYVDPESVEAFAPPAPDIVSDASVSAIVPEEPMPECPQTRPRENSACARTGATCEYGDSADRECNDVLACEGNSSEPSWNARPNDTCFSNVCPLAGAVASLEGTPCSLDADGGPVSDNDEAVCNMTDGICACTTGPDGASKHARRWVCVRALSLCPPNRPLLGAACTGSLWCDYGSCAFKRGVSMECKNGLWLTGGAPCP